MAKFFVGQRVRLVGAKLPENIGLTGRIDEFVHTPKGAPCLDGPAELEGDCAVHYDGDAHASIEHTSRLEPILPEGHRPAELTVEELLPFLRERVTCS